MNYFQDCKTWDEAKAIYKQKAKELHPDLNPNIDRSFFQELNNQFKNFNPENEKYEGEKEQFSSANASEYAHVINQLLTIPNIDIWITGSWIWLSGDTKPVKEEIKNIDCGETLKRGWSKKKSQWYFSPIGYRKKSGKEFSFDQIKNKYGAERVRKEEKKRLQRA